MTILEERMEALEERTDRLETLFGQFMVQTGTILRRMEAESARDREESARFREEFARDREESARFRREMNKRWGELANKMGTIVEDIIAPSLRRMAREEFNCGEEHFFSARISRVCSDDSGLRREFDVLYIGAQAVLLNETKSTPRSEDVRAFVDFLNRDEFALYFPEFQEMAIVPVFSSLHIPADLVTYLTRNRIYAVAMGEEVMQTLNDGDNAAWRRPG